MRNMKTTAAAAAVAVVLGGLATGGPAAADSKKSVPVALTLTATAVTRDGCSAEPTALIFCDGSTTSDQVDPGTVFAGSDVQVVDRNTDLFVLPTPNRAKATAKTEAKSPEFLVQSFKLADGVPDRGNYVLEVEGKLFSKVDAIAIKQSAVGVDPTCVTDRQPQYTFRGLRVWLEVEEQDEPVLVFDHIYPDPCSEDDVVIDDLFQRAGGRSFRVRVEHTVTVDVPQGSTGVDSRLTHNTVISLDALRSSS